MSNKTIVMDGYASNPTTKEINGKQVLNFGINNGNKEAADWHNFSVWGDDAERAEIDSGDYVIVRAVEFMGKPNDKGEVHRKWGRVQVENITKRLARNEQFKANKRGDDDLPF